MWRGDRDAAGGDGSYRSRCRSNTQFQDFVASLANFKETKRRLQKAEEGTYQVIGLIGPWSVREVCLPIVADIEHSLTKQYMEFFGRSVSSHKISLVRQSSKTFSN
jgi:hypothetical protein